jgi:hypothetical protein
MAGIRVLGPRVEVDLDLLGRGIEWIVGIRLGAIQAIDIRIRALQMAQKVILQVSIIGKNQSTE